MQPSDMYGRHRAPADGGALGRRVAGRYLPAGGDGPPPAAAVPVGYFAAGAPPARSPRPRPGTGAPKPSFPLVPLLIAILTVAAMAIMGEPLVRQALAHAEDRPASVADVPAGANAAEFVAAPVAGPANCLAGTWRESRTDVVVQGAHFVGSGAVVRFHPDGTATAEYPGLTYRATVAGRTVDLVISGTVAYRYAVTADTVSYSGISSLRGTTASVAGVTVDAPGSSVRAASPDRYTCTADTLVLAGAARSEFARVR